MSSVHVVILSGYLDENSCILDSLPYLIQKSSLGDLGTRSNVLYDLCVGVLTFSIYSASTLYFLFFNVKYCEKQKYYLDLAKSRGRIGSIASQQCLYQLSILCK